MISDWVWERLRRIIQRIGYRTILQYLLLVSANLIFWVGVQDAIPELRTTQGWLLILIAVCTGWLVAHLVRRAWLGLAVLMGLGMVAVLFFSGGIFTPVSNVFLSIQKIWIEQTGALTWELHAEALLNSLAELGQGVAILLGRFTDWLFAVFGEGSTDPVALQMFWGFLIWSTAAWSGWILHRWDRPLLALFPSGVLLGVLTAYTGNTSIYMLLYLSIYLLLQAQQGYVSRERHWEHSKIDYPDIRIEFGVVAMGITVGLVTAAFLIPSISIKEIAQKVGQLTNPARGESVAESIGLASQSEPESAFQPMLRGGLAREHLLGSGPELSQNIVMQVTIDGISDFQPESDQRVNISPELDPFLSRAPFYWRALTYDRYNSLGWFTSDIQEREQAAGTSLPLAIDSKGLNSVIVRQHVEKFSPTDTYLYHTGSLLAVDQPADIAYRSNGDLFAAQVKEPSYIVDSRLFVVSEDTLRQAGSNYPDWVVNKYLQLPENISKRVRDLAIDLTAREPTPYDRAYAIEQYLRTYPYTLDLPAPPQDVEIADYFIFELQKGYCDYYSTSMVVLARIAGLPARYAVGYATGTWDPENKYFSVSEAEAHSWVEIYFPGIGWIPFEPTGGRPGINRPDLPSINEFGNEFGELTPLTSEVNSFNGFTPLIFAISGLLIIVLGVASVYYVSAHIRRQKMQPSQVIGEFYQQMRTHTNQMGLPIAPGATPIEISKVLSDEVSRLVLDNQTREFIRRTIAWIGEVYSRDQYSVHNVTELEKERAIKSWRWFNQRLLYLRLRAKWLNFRWKHVASKTED